jgi:hypothetical protein
MGVSGRLVGPAAFKAVEASTEGPQTEGVTEITVSDWWAHWRTEVENSPELAAVVTAWPTLPEPVKAGILAMVRASVPAPSGADVPTHAERADMAGKA